LGDRRPRFRWGFRCRFYNIGLSTSQTGSDELGADVRKDDGRALAISRPYWSISRPTQRTALPSIMLARASIAAPEQSQVPSAAGQMALVNLTAMTFTRRLAHVDTIPQQDSSQNALNKLMRTFTNQMETLKRYRSGAQQTVKVEHVHVHEGGQAIVGNVQTGGAAQISEDQPHAEAITHAPEREVQSLFAQEREAVPQRSDEQR